MTRLLLAFSLFLAASTAAAQYDGPAIEACRAFAVKEAKNDSSPSNIVILRDGALFLDDKARKLGAQPVRMVLTGNGAVVFENAPSAELAFVCLLADEKRALFFNWLPRANVSPLAQCTRTEALRAKPRGCLEVLLRAAETDLGYGYARLFQEANEKGGEPLDAYRKSNDAWRQYREAECARRRHAAPADVSPENYELACMVELTRRRRQDMRVSR